MIETRAEELYGPYLEVVVGAIQSKENMTLLSSLDGGERVFLFGHEHDRVLKEVVKHYKESGAVPTEGDLYNLQGLRLDAIEEGPVKEGLSRDWGAIRERLENDRKNGKAPASPTTVRKLIKEVNSSMFLAGLKGLQNGNGEADKLYKRKQGIDQKMDGGDDRFPLRTSNSIYSGEGMVGLSYLVNDILVKGQPCIIGGPEKVCKTWLLLDLLHSLHTRTPFLGYFDTNEYARVLMMSGESGQATLERNLLTLNRERSFPGDEGKDPNPGGLYALSNQVIQFTKPEDLAWLDNSFQTYGWQVVMTDTASLAMDFENAGNSGVMQRQLRGVDEVCQRYGATLIIAHHFNKMGGNVYRPGTLNDLSQAGFREWTRQWLLVTRREPYEAPFDKDQEREHRLTLVAGGSAGHSGEYAINCNEGSQNRPRWDVDVRSRGEARVADNAREGEKLAQTDAERFLAILRQTPGGETEEGLRKGGRVGGSSARVKMGLEVLAREGRVERCEVHKGTWKGPGWRVAPNERPQ